MFLIVFVCLCMSLCVLCVLCIVYVSVRLCVSLCVFVCFCKFVWALRVVWKDTHKGNMHGVNTYVAGKVRKVGGGNPSPQAVGQLFEKMDSDPQLWARQGLWGTGWETISVV